MCQLFQCWPQCFENDDSFIDCMCPFCKNGCVHFVKMEANKSIMHSALFELACVLGHLLITYTLSHSLDMHVNLSSWDRCICSSMSLHVSLKLI